MHSLLGPVGIHGEVQDVSTRTIETFEGKGRGYWREVSEALMSYWDEVEHLGVINLSRAPGDF